MAFAGGLVLGIFFDPLHAAPGGGDTVQGLFAALLSTMKDGRTLGQSGRFTQLEPGIRRSFATSCCRGAFADFIRCSLTGNFIRGTLNTEF